MLAIFCDVEGGYAGGGNTNADPLLSPLANNGGPTRTMALGEGSPCYGAGTETGAPTTDQCGNTRPEPPSIGAYDAPSDSPLTVTNLADGTTAGSLRAAITFANLNPGSTITFQTGLSGTITLGSALPTMTASMTIDGPGAAAIAVDGANQHRPFNVNAATGTVTISALTIQDGNDQTDALGSGRGGGGVEVQSGIVTMSACTLTRNTAANMGGAIFNASGASLTLVNSTLAGNSGLLGAGLFNNGAVALRNCTLSGNSANDAGIQGGAGGALYNLNGTANLTNCTLEGNSGYDGGGINNNENGTIVLTNCTMSGNSGTVGGAIYNAAAATLANCILYVDTVPDPAGGAEVAGGGQLTATYSDIHGGYPGADNISADPLLGALANNGGSTQPHSLGLRLRRAWRAGTQVARQLPTSVTISGPVRQV